MAGLISEINCVAHSLDIWAEWRFDGSELCGLFLVSSSMKLDEYVLCAKEESDSLLTAHFANSRYDDGDTLKRFNDFRGDVRGNNGILGSSISISKQPVLSGDLL